MELIDTQVGTPVQSWLSRVEKRQLAQADYFSELRSWVQHAILEAEEKRDLNKKGKLLNLLEDLQECPENGFKMEEITGKKE
jgi:hypothetical protein